MSEGTLNEHEVVGNYGERFVDPAYMREFMAAHPEWMRKRFIIWDREGRFVAGVYAERYEVYAGVGNSFTGAKIGNFYIGADIVATVELSHGVTVSDSQGRAWDRKGDILARIKHETERLRELQSGDEELALSVR